MKSLPDNVMTRLGQRPCLKVICLGADEAATMDQRESFNASQNGCRNLKKKFIDINR